MGSCELCGAPDARFTNHIEGAIMKVCGRCSTSGRILEEERFEKTYSSPRSIQPDSAKKEETLEIRHDFSSVFLTQRNKRQMTQEQFSQFLNIKQSMAASFETGAHKPSLGLAQKMEKVLKVALIEVVSASSEFELSKEPRVSGMTLGHFMKKKK